MGEMKGRPAHDALTELLVLNAQAGDDQAFASLYKLWSPRLLRHVGRLVNDHHAARDVDQNVWMAIARGLRRVGDPALFGAWAYRIATHKAADWTREQQRRRRLTPAAPVSDNGRVMSDVEQVREAIRRLSPDQRALLSMHYAEDLGVAHIARALDVPQGTVKSRLHAARAALRRVLELQEGQS